MKKIAAVLSMAAIAGLAACSEGPTSALAPDQAHFNSNQNTVNGPTWVLGTFSFVIENGGGSGFEVGQNAHPQAGQTQGGSCRNAAGTPNPDPGSPGDYPIWYNGQDNQTNAKFCQGTEGEGEDELVICTVSGDGIPATYAAHAHDPVISGNENLNFLIESEADEAGDRHVHYKSRSNQTSGKGALSFDVSCTGDRNGTASLGLALFNSIGNGFQDGPPGDRQLDVNEITADITINGDTFAASVDDLYWFFRSRVGA